MDSLFYFSQNTVNILGNIVNIVNYQYWHYKQIPQICLHPRCTRSLTERMRSVTFIFESGLNQCFFLFYICTDTCLV